jgi:hypothetical protein
VIVKKIKIRCTNKMASSSNDGKIGSDNYKSKRLKRAPVNADFVYTKLCKKGRLLKNTRGSLLLL